MASIGRCVNGNCNEDVDFGSIEVIDEGFVCSTECENELTGR